jgi:hypothetical protein
VCLYAPQLKRPRAAAPTPSRPGGSGAAGMQDGGGWGGESSEDGSPRSAAAAGKQARVPHKPLARRPAREDPRLGLEDPLPAQAALRPWIMAGDHGNALGHQLQWDPLTTTTKFLSSVLIPGKSIPEAPNEDTSITKKNGTALEEEITFVAERSRDHVQSHVARKRRIWDRTSFQRQGEKTNETR